MEIKEVRDGKKQFISLLLLADEQENMIDRYLENGTMYVLEDNGVKAECVVTDEGSGILEIKNIAVVPEHQRNGYGKALIDFLVRKYADGYSVLQVGTPYRFMKNAASSVSAPSRISLRTTTTTRYMNPASCCRTWCICKNVYRFATPETRGFNLKPFRAPRDGAGVFRPHFFVSFYREKG